jgi:HK97 family phage prohead protease
MPEKNVSLDEFLSRRKASARDGVVFKVAKAPVSWNKETRTGRFVMSTQDKDRDDDIVYTAGIDLSGFSANPICLLNHRSADPIGTWANVTKSERSMEGDAVLGPAGTTAEIDKAAGLIGAGILRASSIGFIPKTVKRIVMEDGSPTWSYEIVECELVECSIVSVPANPMALAKDAGDLGLCFRFIEEVLDTYAKDPATGLIVPKAEYEAAQKALSGNRTTVVGGFDPDAVDSKGLIERIADRVKSILNPPPKPPTADEIKAAKDAALEALKLVA